MKKSLAIYVLSLAGLNIGLYQVVPRVPAPQGLVKKLLYAELISVSNAADTNYVKTSTYTLPANTITKANDRIFIELYATGGAFGTSKIYGCNIGFSGWTAAGSFTGGINVIQNATTTSNPNWNITGFLVYATSSTGWSMGNSWVNGSGQASNYVTRSPTWTANQDVACNGNDAGANAGAITLREFRVYSEIFY